jgi:5-hydroxyisourate hydrolase
MAGISTHVLDTAQGCPAAGVPVRLDIAADGGWREVSSATTDDDGRVADLLDGASPDGTVYRIRFDTSAYLGDAAFFPEVTVVFRIGSAAEHHHVPLLLSPFGYSTYRGS